MIKTKNKNGDASKKLRNGPIMEIVESVPGAEGSLWWERSVKDVGLQPGVKERGSYGWWEGLKCDRSVHLHVRLYLQYTLAQPRWRCTEDLTGWVWYDAWPALTHRHENKHKTRSLPNDPVLRYIHNLFFKIKLAATLRDSRLGCNPHRSLWRQWWRHNSEIIRDREKRRPSPPWNPLSYPLAKTASLYDNFCKTGNDVIYDVIICVQDGNSKNGSREF